MVLSGIQPGQGMYSPSFTQKKSSCSAQLPVAPPRQSDTVNFSEQARERIQKDQAPAGVAQPDPGTIISVKDLPIEAFSLPDWYADLLPEYTLVDDELGIPYSESRRARYDSLTSKGKDNLSEYSNTLTEYFQDELKNAGISGPMDYHTSIVQNKDRSESVHQAMRQRLSNDPRAMELMEYFGISL